MDRKETGIKIRDYISLYNKHFIRDKKEDHNPTFLRYIFFNFVPFPITCILVSLYILFFKEFNLIIAIVLMVFIGLFILISVLLDIITSRKTFRYLYFLQESFFEKLRYEKIKFSLEKSKFTPKLEIEIDKYSMSNPTVEFINQTKKMKEKLIKKTKIESGLCCVFVILFIVLNIINDQSDSDIYFYFIISIIGIIVILAYLCISFQSVDYFLDAVLGADIERWHSIGSSDIWKNKTYNNVLNSYQQ